MNQAILLVAALLALPAHAATKKKPAPQAPSSEPAEAPAPPPAPRRGAMTDEERAYCRQEIDVLENRRKIFEAQKLSPSEIERKNASATDALAECRQRYVEVQRGEAERRADVEETDRRAGANATEIEREKVWREVRRERLVAKNPSTLTPEEREELNGGLREEEEATQNALDSSHSKDAAFMRTVHSAIACYHGERFRQLSAAIRQEEHLLRLGTGDKQKLYNLQADLKTCEAVLARSAEQSAKFRDGLAGCDENRIAVLTHCVKRRYERQPDAACESEEIQQYARFIK